jgi:hypothetical protein
MSISLFTHPIQTTQILCTITSQFVRSSLKQIPRPVKTAFLLLIAAIVLPQTFEGPHSESYMAMNQYLAYVFYWIILGVASSIGLGNVFYLSFFKFVFLF